MILTFAEWRWDDSKGDDEKPIGRPLNIAHRGESGLYPEHTEIAYKNAALTADYVECDVTVTKDLVLVCSHEPQISDVSNVKDFPQFASLEQTYRVDDDDVNFNWNDKGDVKDFYVWDFTLKELLKLKRKQVRAYRDPNYDWEFGFITFDEYLAMSKEYGFGIYPEIKHGAATNKVSYIFSALSPD